MSDEKKAGALILSQLGMFNESRKLFENTVETAILDGFDRAVEKFAEVNDWVGKFELSGDDSECWLAPKDWNSAEPGEEPDVKARFKVHCINDDDDYWTALFCGQGGSGGEAGFSFSVRPNKEKGGKTAWNKYAQLIDPALILNLASDGFKNLGKGVFMLPVRLDVNLLASTWEENEKFSYDDDVFFPLVQALEKLKTAQNIFNQILNSAPV